MPIDEPDARGGREMFVDDPFKGEVRLFALMAAEIRSVRVRVLPLTRALNSASAPYSARNPASASVRACWVSKLQSVAIRCGCRRE